MMTSRIHAVASHLYDDVRRYHMICLILRNVYLMGRSVLQYCLLFNNLEIGFSATMADTSIYMYMCHVYLTA